MKKIFFVLVALTCVLFLASCKTDYYNGFVLDQTDEDFVVTDDKELIKYQGNSSFVQIPEDVLVIREGAFKDNENLYSITIPEGLLRIDDNAFINCYRLVEIYNFSNLKIEAHDLGNGNVSKYALVVHNQLEKSNITNTSGGFISLIIDDKDYLIDYIGTQTMFIVPVRFNELNDYAFYNKNVKSISLSSQITKVGAYSFAECRYLYNAGLGSTLTGIGEYAFYNCKSLIEVTLPKTLEQIEDYAFFGCDKLISITNLSNKIDIKLQETSNGYIGYYALNIDKIYLNTLNIQKTNGFITYDYDGETHLIDYRGSEGIIVIPDDVLIIDDNAFDVNDRIVSITLTNVKTIGSSLDNLPILLEIYNLSHDLVDEDFSNINYYDYYIDAESISKLEKRFDSIIYNHEDETKELVLVNAKEEIYDLIVEVDSINEYAFHNSGIKKLIVNDKLTNLESKVLKLSEIEEIYYCGYAQQFDEINDEVPDGIQVYYYSKYFHEGSWHYAGNTIEFWTKDYNQKEQSSLSK